MFFSRTNKYIVDEKNTKKVGNVVREFSNVSRLSFFNIMANNKNTVTKKLART